MRAHRRLKAKVGLIGLLAGLLPFILVLTAGTNASAVTVANGCKNSAVPTDWTGINVDLTGTAPATVAPGGSVSLTSISQTLALPGSLFVAGYNLGLLSVGANTVPGTIKDTISATNATVASQDTNTVNVSVTFTITDPDGTPGSGDETGTDATVTNSFANMNWTAGSSGTMDFAESNAVEPPTSTTGGIVINATIGGFLTIHFGCSPGTVVGSSPGTFTAGTAGPFASTTIQSGGGNNPPVANAGPDQTVASGATVTLDGSASSDPDGDPLTYAWSQTSGPSVTLSSTTVAKPTFTAPTGPTTLAFQLQVCDTAPLCSTDSVTINVSGPGGNNPPVANAGPNQTVTLGATVTLDGSGSTDPDGDTLTYAWTKTSGPSVKLSNASAAKPTFTAPAEPATLVFQLQVCDPSDACSTDSVTINVSAPHVNAKPVAKAGPDQTVASGAFVSLDGSGSTDPDGDTLTYAWTQASGTAVTLFEAGTAKPSFVAPTGPATLVFQLQACDSGQLCSTDTVTIHVSAPTTTVKGTTVLPKTGSDSRGLLLATAFLLWAGTALLLIVYGPRALVERWRR